jgi:XRE family transcriptional regulator, regulator of sulfur utilization
VRSRRSTAVLCVAIGEAVRAERKRLGWSQEELADQAGLSRAYVTELESGGRTPNLDTLSRLAHAFGMKTSKLLAAGEARLPER